MRKAVTGSVAAIFLLLSNATPHADAPTASPHAGNKTAANPVRAASPAKADADDGERVALIVCSSCHVVSPTQDVKPVLQPPAASFRSIANKADTTEASLRHFIGTTHKGILPPDQMPNPELSDEQLANVVRFIMTLRHSRDPR